MNQKKFLADLPNETKLEFVEDDKSVMTAVFRFSQTGFGFGEVVFKVANGKVYCDNETMKRERIKQILSNFVDSAIIPEEITSLPDLIEYDRVMGITARGGLPHHIQLKPGEQLPDYIERLEDGT